MCGAQEGLLGLVAGQFKITNIETNRETILDNLSGSAVQLEPSLAEEGALWFQNLLAPDPFLILPFVLSGVLFTAVTGGNSAFGGRKRKVSARSRRLGVSLKLCALAIGPLTLDVPSAVLVYWISTSGISIAQHWIFDKLQPLRLPVQPCKPKKTPIGALFTKAKR